MYDSKARWSRREKQKYLFFLQLIRYINKKQISLSRDKSCEWDLNIWVASTTQNRITHKNQAVPYNPIHLSGFRCNGCLIITVYGTQFVK